MWDCPECGCLSIAASLTTCPMCGKERDMPTTTTGGASNALAQPGETGYVPPEVTAVEVTAEAATAAGAALDVTPGGAETPGEVPAGRSPARKSRSAAAGSTATPEAAPVPAGDGSGGEPDAA